MLGTTPLTFSIDAFNRAPYGQATAMMDRVVERSHWLAHRAVEARPFSNAEDLAIWLEHEVNGLPQDEALQLLCAHPELSPPDPSAMTKASQSEQNRFDLMNLDTRTAARLAELNRQYLRRHGYPFIVALHEHDELPAVLEQFEGRLSAEPQAELAHALGQIVSVMKARLARLTSATPPPKEPRSKASVHSNSGSASR